MSEDRPAHAPHESNGIWTVGYEGTTLETFIAVLQQHRVETLLDVRAVPISRKRGFSRRGLASALQAAGIDYLHLPQLGCPKPIRDAYYRSRDWAQYAQDFLAWVMPQDAALADVATRAETSRCALMCFEANPLRCHRSLVAAVIATRGKTLVKHLRLA